MLEKIVYLQNEVLGAPPEIALPAAIFLFVVLIGLMLGRGGRTQTVDNTGLEAKVRRWIGDRIAEHISILAEAYGDARASAELAELPPGFAETIETFIAEVLHRERDAGHRDVDLGEAVREFVVLHRAEIYDDVTARTREYLAGA